MYIRGQVPGPAGSFVYLRDAYNTTPEFRANWGLPFPTYVSGTTGSTADTAALPVTVWRNPKDPYRMYSEETDYFPITVSTAVMLWGGSMRSAPPLGCTCRGVSRGAMTDHLHVTVSVAVWCQQWCAVVTGQRPVTEGVWIRGVT